MHAFSTNYLERKGERRVGTVLDRGFWIHGLPRAILMCRLFGHRPVVDGTDPTPLAHSTYRGLGNRWVCCDRCGVRPDPQGSLDPDVWEIGQRYTGPFRTDWPTEPDERFRAIKARTHGEPGPWPQRPTGAVGGQLVIGRTFSTGIEVKVGNPGSEQVLAGHVGIAPLGALYLHTEAFGTWLQRRLNPHRYESRVTGFSIHGGHLYWRVWARRNESSRDDPWWQHGSFRIDPRDIVLGPKRYSYQDVGNPVTATLRMPHGDDHQVELQLQRQTLARTRAARFGRLIPRRWQVTESWQVDVEATPGIPTKPGGRGRIGGFGVDVPDHAATRDWIAAALAEAAGRMTRDRARYDYRPPTESGQPVSSSTGTVQLELSDGPHGSDQVTIRVRAGDELASAVLTGSRVAASPDLQRLPEVIGSAVRAGLPLQQALDEAVGALTRQGVEE